MLYLQLVLKAGLYHGSENLCPLLSTREVPLTSGWVSWNEELSFEVSLGNIPRAAKLCFALYSVATEKEKQARAGRTSTQPRKAKSGGKEVREGRVCKGLKSGRCAQGLEAP